MGRKLGLLDTSTLISSSDILDENIQYFVSSTICRAELETGIELARQSDIPMELLARESRLEALDELELWVPFDVAASREAGFIAATLSPKAGKLARSKDVLIAGHARSLRLPVITHNLTDFRRFRIEAISVAEAEKRMDAIKK